MGNINVNRTNTNDTADNVIRRYNDGTIVDFRGITLLVAAIIILLTLIWLIVLAMVKFDCWWNEDYLCVTSTYVFWGYLAIYGTALVIALIASVPFIYQAVKNTAFIRFRGVAMHRNDIRQNSKDVLNVAFESAKSEATAGIDNLSPSIAYHNTAKTENNSAADNNAAQFSDEIPLALLDKL